MKSLHLHITYGDRIVEDDGRVDWQEPWDAIAHLFTMNEPLGKDHRKYICEQVNLMLDQLQQREDNINASS